MARRTGFLNGVADNATVDRREVWKANFAARSSLLGLRLERDARPASALEGVGHDVAKQPIYVGPLKDNKTGKIVIDKTYDNLDPFIDKMDYLLEGVVGSLT